MRQLPSPVAPAGLALQQLRMKAQRMEVTTAFFHTYLDIIILQKKRVRLWTAIKMRGTAIATTGLQRLRSRLHCISVVYNSITVLR